VSPSGTIRLAVPQPGVAAAGDRRKAVACLELAAGGIQVGDRDQNVVELDHSRLTRARHELPLSIGDPFLLGTIGGRLHIMGCETFTSYPYELTP
jgi:hypothetical protein